MLVREPVEPVVLALKKVGGAGEVGQLAATTGMPARRILSDLRRIAATGVVDEVSGTWLLRR